MNLDLEQLLNRAGVECERIPKSQKVKLLAKWVREFPDLVAAARQQHTSKRVDSDQRAAARLAQLQPDRFYVLPDDDSGMPACGCAARQVPDLSELVSDTMTKCDELVLVDEKFRWSAVYINHGAAELVGRHFMGKDSSGSCEST